MGSPLRSEVREGSGLVWPGVADYVYFAKPRGGLCWVANDGAHTQPDVKPGVTWPSRNQGLQKPHSHLGGGVSELYL